VTLLVQYIGNVGGGFEYANEDGSCGSLCYQRRTTNTQSARKGLGGTLREEVSKEFLPTVNGGRTVDLNRKN
jgi:hypothetical protein